MERLLNNQNSEVVSTLTEIVLHLYFFYYSISSSGKVGDVSTLIIHIVAIVEDLKTNNLIFSAQVIGLNPVFKYEKKHIVLLIKTYSQIWV